MSKKRHTPTPWGLRPSGLIATVDGNARFIARVETHEGDDGTDEANGEFIVRACNAYDDMLAALKRAEGELLIATSTAGSQWGWDHQAVNVIRAAVAKAEGKDE